MRFRVQLKIWVVFFIFDSGAVKSWENLNCIFLGMFFCFAAPEIKLGSIEWQATILPLNHRCWILTVSIFSTIFCSSFQFFHQSFESKSSKLFYFFLIKVSNSAEYLSVFLLFWQWNCKILKILILRFSRKTICPASAGSQIRVYC